MNRATIAAVYTFCAHYHSGQSSRGYRLLSRAGAAWERQNGTNRCPLGYWETLVSDPDFRDTRIARTYRHLVANHSNDI